MHYAFAHMCGQTDGRTPSCHYPLQTINIQTHINPVLSLYRSSLSSLPSSPSWSYGVIWEGGLGQHWFEVLIRIATGGVPKACMSVCAWVYVFVFVFTGLYGSRLGTALVRSDHQGGLQPAAYSRLGPGLPTSLHTLSIVSITNTNTQTQSQINKHNHR